MKVIKRDGTTVEFDRNKIKRAIRKANEAVDPDFRVTEEQVEQIVHNIESKKRNRYLVEDIQDLVEQGLVEENKFHLAKTYIIYRYNRALVRKANTTDESILSLLRNENKELAEAFIDYYLSYDVQLAEALDGVDAPVRPDVELTAEQAANFTYGEDMIANLKLPDWNVIAANQANWIASWNAIFSVK